MNFNSKTSGFYAFLQKVTTRKAIYLEHVTNFRLRCHGICDFANRPLEKTRHGTTVKIKNTLMVSNSFLSVLFTP